MTKIDGGLRQLFRQYIPEAMWVSIESGSTEQGIPDSFGCFPGGICFWVEFKKTADNKIDIRPGQTAWHERYARMGGRSFIAVRYQRDLTTRMEAADELLIYPGSKVRKLQLGGRVAAIPLCRYANGPAGWDWDKVKVVLIGKMSATK